MTMFVKWMSFPFKKYTRIFYELKRKIFNMLKTEIFFSGNILLNYISVPVILFKEENIHHMNFFGWGEAVKRFPSQSIPQ